MKNTKFFELSEADASLGYWFMSIVVSRCAGLNVDPDTGQDWTHFKNVTVSIIRSIKDMPEAMENHNVVSNNVFQFTVQELAADTDLENTNPQVSAIGKAIAKLPIRRCSSRFFLKVELD